jgi:hypothetical protein
MPRFVLLYHETPPGYERPSHWDLMFESGDVLRTWSLAELPREWQGIRMRTMELYGTCPELAGRSAVAAHELGDHRRDYLRYEGPVSGNRGRVSRVAEGTYRAEEQSSERWHVTVSGRQLRGRLTLRREGPGHFTWRLIYQADA